MSFWKNVAIELEYKGIGRKELSFTSGVPMSTIHKGMERDSIPSADSAIRIAKVLDVSLEYLLDMEESGTKSPKKKFTDSQATKLYRKYNRILNQLEKLSQKERTAVTLLVETLSQDSQES